MAAASVTRDELLVQVAVLEEVLAFPATRIVSPAAATATADESVFLRKAKVEPLFASLPLMRSTYFVAISVFLSGEYEFVRCFNESA